MEQQKIGNFLKQLRKEKGLTQEQFAERFYISSRTVSRWETGRSLPDAATMPELCDLLKINLSELFSGSESQWKTTRKLRMLCFWR